MIRYMKGLQYILTNSIQLNPFKWNFMYYGSDQEQLRGRHIYRILNQLRWRVTPLYTYTYTSTPSHKEQ